MLLSPPPIQSSPSEVVSETPWANGRGNRRLASRQMASPPGDLRSQRKIRSWQTLRSFSNGDLLAPPAMISTPLLTPANAPAKPVESGSRVSVDQSNTALPCGTAATTDELTARRINATKRARADFMLLPSSACGSNW